MVVVWSWAGSLAAAPHIYILIRSSPPRHVCAGNVGNEIDDRETGAECGHQGLCVIILMTTVMTVIMLLMVITRAVKILRELRSDDSFMPFLHNDTENNFQIGKYCLRQEVRAEEGRCGDQAAWRQPVARGRCSEDCEEPLICQLQV